MESLNWEKAAEKLLEGSVGVLPTDTIYGLSALISNTVGIEKIYEIKKRNKKKPLIVLAASLEQIIKNLPVTITDTQRKIIEASTTPTSFIYQIKKDALNFPGRTFFESDIAIRIPITKPNLIHLLEKTGPIVSTSVNLEGQPAQTNPQEIQQNFAEAVDFLVSEGIKKASASQVIRLDSEGNQELLR